MVSGTCYSSQTLVWQGQCYVVLFHYVFPGHRERAAFLQLGAIRLGSDYENVGKTEHALSSMVIKSVQITYNLFSLSVTTKQATYEDDGIKNGKGHPFASIII